MFAPQSPIMAESASKSRFHPLWRDIVHLLSYWHHRQRSRKVLGRLEARLLEDINISADEACRESKKAFWQD